MNNKLQSISYDWQDRDINDKLDSMISNATPIDIDSFQSMADLEFTLDEDEFLSDSTCQDVDSVFFETIVDDQKVIGMRVAGAVNLFSETGELPNLELLEVAQCFKELQMDALAWVLSKENSPNSIMKTDEEELKYETSKVRCFTSNDGENARYQLMSKGEPIAAIFVKEDIIDTIYTSLNYRKKGLEED